VAKNKTLFDDRPVEVQELTQILKVEIAKLNSQIAELQNFQRMRKTGGYIVGTNRSAEEHSSQVVVSLQSRLAEASSTFTNVLEMRSQNIKAQRDRRDQFSATNIMPGTRSVKFSFVVPSVSRQRNVKDHSPNKDSSDGHVAIEMPTQSLQQLSLMTAASDTSYLESRSAALQGIESTINELGSIYQQLATMIAEQGEVVQRIDMNVEDMQLNIERGQGELLKYLKNVSSNRWLMVKIFAVLLIFVVFFSVFLI
jgi:syntaxin 5